MRQTKILQYSAALLMLTACATNDTAERQPWGDSPAFVTDNLTPIALTASDAANTAVSTDTTAATRAETDIQTALFDADEILQGYLWHVGDASNSFSPLLTTREAVGSKNPLVANQQIYWPADITKTISLYALYPSEVTKATTSFTVQADQREDESYKASDLMYGSCTNVPYSDDPLNIPFKHKMAKLVVNAASDGSVSGVDVTGITVKGVKRKIEFDAVNGTLGDDSTLDDEGDILMSNNGACLLPPQDIDAGAAFIEVAVTVGGTTTPSTATFKAESAMTLKEGYQYTLNLEIGSQSLGLTASISDWDVKPYYTITPKEWGSITMNPITGTYTYNGLEQKPTVVVSDAASNTPLTEDTHYTLDYYANTNAGTALVVATGKSGTDYVGQVAVQQFTINPAVLTITAEDKSKTYGDDNPDLTYTITGWQNGESADSNPSGWNAPTVTTTAEKFSDVKDGGYPITPSGAEASNYTFSYVNGALTINKKAVTGWSIDPTTMTLDEGATGTITIDYGEGVSGGKDPEDDHGTVSYSTSSTNATASDGTVTGKSAGSATITVEIADGTNYTFDGQKSCAVTVESGKYVNLGLSVKWAKTNVGAKNEYDYGLYFAWGETTGYSASVSHQFRNVNYSYKDNPKTLPDDHDAAKKSSDYSDGRMPTIDEIEELINNTTQTWVKINGISGMKFTSKKSGYTDNYIFLPAAGYGADKLYDLGEQGSYWSSSIGSSNYNANILEFSFDDEEIDTVTRTVYRYYGMSVRAVKE